MGLGATATVRLPICVFQLNLASGGELVKLPTENGGERMAVAGLKAPTPPLPSSPSRGPFSPHAVATQHRLPPSLAFSLSVATTITGGIAIASLSLSLSRDLHLSYWTAATPLQLASHHCPPSPSSSSRHACSFSLQSRTATRLPPITDPLLLQGWAVDQAILAEEERLVVIRFGHDWDETCMQPIFVSSNCLPVKALKFEPAGHAYHSATLKLLGVLEDKEGEADDKKVADERESSYLPSFDSYSGKSKNKSGFGDKQKDHYALLGLSHLRYLATEDQIRKSYREINAKLSEKERKEESVRICVLVDNAYKRDPRILRIKEEEKAEKQRKKQAKHMAKKLQEEEAARIAEEER
ncbi:hypothetical protein RIF29_33429 [Crotalaria pallida]|uniref:Uncharacterized protein n=1 Tax=Crotalaria pallida TaxID=3830 RepID=A0AAN9E8A7_CROPI